MYSIDSARTCSESDREWFLSFPLVKLRLTNVHFESFDNRNLTKSELPKMGLRSYEFKCRGRGLHKI